MKKRKKAIAIILIGGSLLAAFTLYRIKPSRNTAEETRLAAAYVTLQQSMERREFAAAYDLMSRDYRKDFSLDEHVSMHSANDTFYYRFASDSIVRVKDNKGEVRISPTSGKEFWVVFFFDREDGNWRYTHRSKMQ